MMDNIQKTKEEIKKEYNKNCEKIIKKQFTIKVEHAIISRCEI